MTLPDGPEHWLAPTASRPPMRRRRRLADDLGGADGATRGGAPTRAQTLRLFERAVHTHAMDTEHLGDGSRTHSLRPQLPHLAESIDGLRPLSYLHARKLAAEVDRRTAVALVDVTPTVTGKQRAAAARQPSRPQIASRTYCLHSTWSRANNPTGTDALRPRLWHARPPSFCSGALLAAPGFKPATYATQGYT